MTNIRIEIPMQTIQKLAIKLVKQAYPDIKKITIEALNKNVLMTKSLIDPTDTLVGTMKFPSDLIEDIKEKNEKYKLIMSNGLRLEID